MIPVRSNIAQMANLFYGPNPNSIALKRYWFFFEEIAQAKSPVECSSSANATVLTVSSIFHDLSNIVVKVWNIVLEWIKFFRIMAANLKIEFPRRVSAPDLSSKFPFVFCPLREQMQNRNSIDVHQKLNYLNKSIANGRFILFGKAMKAFSYQNSMCVVCFVYVCLRAFHQMKEETTT